MSYHSILPLFYSSVHSSDLVRVCVKSVSVIFTTFAVLIQYIIHVLCITAPSLIAARISLLLHFALPVCQLGFEQTHFET